MGNIVCPNAEFVIFAVYNAPFSGKQDSTDLEKVNSLMEVLGNTPQQKGGATLKVKHSKENIMPYHTRKKRKVRWAKKKDEAERESDVASIEESQLDLILSRIRREQPGFGKEISSLC